MTRLTPIWANWNVVTFVSMVCGGRTLANRAMMRLGDLTRFANFVTEMMMRNFDMKIEVLSANAGKWKSEYVGCSPVRWNGVMSRYSAPVRGHCANLAAHSHDVLLIDDRLFIGHAHWNSQQPMFGDWLDQGAGDYSARLKGEAVSAEVLAQLYDGDKRLFPLPNNT